MIGVGDKGVNVSAPAAPRIRPLSLDHAVQLHSSRQVVTVTDAVIALLKNSLDAGAGRVEIAVDLARGSCSIDDDGSGILPDDFCNLARAHCTSKNIDGETCGSKGTDLSSIAALSLLKISSLHGQHELPCTLVLHRGRMVQMLCPDASSSLESCGTRVSVSDLCGNMPVRVKQRDVALSGRGAETAWRELKYRIVSLLLASPRLCVVNVRDGTRTFTLGSSFPLTQRNLLHRGHKANLKDKLPVVFQASFAQNRPDWIPVRASAGGLSVQGLLCLKPAPTKQCQFISIGVRPCLPSTHGNLFDIVNKTVANSSFGVDLEEESAGRKSVDRWPMFVIRLQLGRRSSEESVQEAAADLLEATVRQWLVAHHFQPRKKRSRVEPEGPAPDRVNFRGECSRIRAGAQSRPSKHLIESASADVVCSECKTVKQPSSEFGSIDEAELLRAADEAEGRTDGSMNWTNPVTREGFQVNSRTGAVLMMRKRDDIRNGDTVKRMSSTRLMKCSDQTDKVPPKFIQDWQNPVFACPAEQPIQALQGPDAKVTKHDCLGEGILSDTLRISKAQLSQSRVINQVDGKFILCSVPCVAETLLILVDQHAASERIILEDLLSELHSPATESIFSNTGHTSAVKAHIPTNPPLFKLTSKELALFARHASYFAKWGITYDLSEVIKIRSLPVGIAERCLANPRILRDLLRAEAWTAEEGGNTSCPTRIREMLCSRACRSAIMFNDLLNKEECTALISRLARCDLPFVCAHGRVSVVPVVRV
ncbi:hypothetical protein K470DRAFT_260734 [Piedraia hortae CBS 480.64]|uniref:MutL C-terminal dimerisation domain-containing protein n=1 Tax=Piedraia hortae CBS 480.64 TaxID=1314780 RepID=A0A6A7BRY2_9PEZI|nr:hypothetical protein K470DRAFT_260734 [Piedraia hortae CBS 480.64]